MKNEIKKYKFSDLYEMSSGLSSSKEQAGHGAPFISFSTVFNNYFLPEIIKDKMNTSLDEQLKFSVKKGDILVTRTSETIDELAMSSVALCDYPQVTYSGFVKRLRPKKGNTVVYDKYIGFYLRSDLFRKTMTNNASMTTRASFNEDIFSFLHLYLPSFETQKKVGDFLYKIEQKININNQINDNLVS
ncbi:MAG: restriction endonuclease subunit S [Longibaculum sp.]